MSENFILTLTSVDILPGWAEVRAVWNYIEHNTLEEIQDTAWAQRF